MKKSESAHTERQNEHKEMQNDLVEILNNQTQLSLCSFSSDSFVKMNILS